MPASRRRAVVRPDHQRDAWRFADAMARAYSASLSLPSWLRSALSNAVMTSACPAASALDTMPSPSRSSFLNAAWPSASSAGRLLPLEDESFFEDSPFFPLAFGFALVVLRGVVPPAFGVSGWECASVCSSSCFPFVAGEVLRSIVVLSFSLLRVSANAGIDNARQEKASNTAFMAAPVIESAGGAAAFMPEHLVTH